MKKLKPFILIVAISIASCNTKTSSSHSKDSLNATTNVLSSHLKSLDELQMALMDAKLDKVTDLLGQPDDKGENGYGSLGHYIYYDKVNDGGKIKNLLIFWKYDANHDSFKSIKRVEAVSNGGSVRLGTYGKILVEKPKGFGNENKNVGSKANDIDDQSNLIDTNKSIPTVFGRPGKEVKYYRDEVKVRLVKIVVPLAGDDYSITRYYFTNNEKLQLVIEEDKKHGLYTKKSYVVNDKVVRYIVQGTEKPCGASDNCSYDEFSEPYVWLKEFYKPVN